MYKILIIDDDRAHCTFTQNALKNEIYDIETRSDAGDLFHLLEDNTPDLILLDFLMPEINGFEVCKALRENELTRSITIMAVTCLTKERDIERIFACGADEYLAKPFKVDQLLEKVTELIGRGRSVD